MGLTILSIREIARNNEKAPIYLGKTVILKVWLSIGAFVAISVFAAFTDMADDTRIMVYLLGGCIIFQNMGMLFSSAMQAGEQMQYLFVAEIIEKMFLLIFSMLMLKRGNGLISIGIIYLLAGILYCTVNVFFVYWKFFKPIYEIDLKFWKDSLKQSLPMAMIGIISMINYHADIVMLGKIKGEEVAGLYGVSYQIFFALATFPGAFLSAAFPSMSRFFKESEEMLIMSYRKSLKVIVGSALPVSVGTFLMSSRVIEVLFGSQYNTSGEALRLLSLALIFSYVNALAGYFLTSIDRQMLIVKIICFTTSLNVILNLILIPKYSYTGAVVATIVSEALFFLIFMIVLPAEYKKNSVPDIAKTIIASIIMGFNINLMAAQEIHIWIIIPANLFLYGTIIWFIGFFTPGEKIRLRSAFLGEAP
jgi:O-antigen/teichoic acid export membrane protein